jgi:uncharacterized protein (TIGR02302 family)
MRRDSTATRRSFGRTASQPAQTRGLRARLLAARLALLWERLWLLLWPPLGVLGLFLGLALLDVLPLLPGWLHLVVLAAFLLALVAGLARGARRLALPRPEEAQHRLERDSGLDHRPLSSLQDELVTPANDPESRDLWQAHRQRLLQQIARLRVGLPRPGLAAADPLALRAVVFLVVVVGLAAGHGDWRDRLGASVAPQISARGARLPASLDVWINPPEYTGLPPLFLEPVEPTADGAPAPAVRVPLGSRLLAQVTSGESAPSLTVGPDSRAFEPIGGEAYRISAELKAGERIVVMQDGESLGDWPLELVADRPPEIELTTTPTRTGRGILRLEYEAEDDYGVVGVRARFERVDRSEPESFEIDLLVPGGDRRKIKHASFHDLTAHLWAGLHVDLRLIAKDAVGQEDMSYPVRILMPERIFNHPVARALVTLRKQLTLDPDARFPVIRALSEINERPARFFYDLVVALAIRSAERRLIYDPREQAVREVQQLLWDTALHIEEGEFAVAERDLRAIQEALMRALQEGASDEEIAQLMDQLQDALDRYLSALAEQMSEQLAQGAEPQPLPPNAQLLGSDELRSMIERARELAQSGARDAARELLEQLRNMLENMQAGVFGQEFNQNGLSAWQMMDQMEGLMQNQQELLDRSFERAQRGEPDSDTRQRQWFDESLADSRLQESLRRDLGEMMRRLGEALGGIPRPLGRAEQAMRDARDALEQGQPGAAVDPQTRALDQLQQGMRAMAERFIERLGRAAQQGSGQLGVQQGQGRDPLGRRWGEGIEEALEGVRVPDELEVQRAREILGELRRRRGERTRPDEELQYIDRLLRRF